MGDTITRKRVILWGVGNMAERVYDMLDRQMCAIVGVVDGRYRDMGVFHEHPVECPDILRERPFDVVVVTPKRWWTITDACRDMGISDDRIVCYWKDSGRDAPIFERRMFKYAEMEDELQKWKNRALNAPYEYAANPPIRVRSGLELLQRILRERCSVSRFGDGEFSTILGEERYIWFQSKNATLGERLLDVLHRRDGNLVLTVQDNLGDLSCYKEWVADIFRKYYVEKNRRVSIMGLLDPTYEYYDTCVTRPYITYRDPHHGEAFFRLWRQIFAHRNILLVEGAKSRFGVGSDLLSTAKSVRRILAPAKNAFSVYDEILAAVQRHAASGDLVLVSLGPTATVLAADIARAGWQAIDIGQLDNEYDWYHMGAERQVPIPGKMAAEVYSGSIEGHCNDKAFFSQVVEIVKEQV